MNKFTLEEPTQIDPGAVTALIKNFEKISRERVSNKKLKKIKPVRIKFEDHFIQTFSGKTIWKRKGDASSALNLYLQGCFSYLFRYTSGNGFTSDRPFRGPNGKYYSYKEKDAICEEAKRLIKNTLVEFVEVNNEV